jgi:spore coat polysaccharide biosynthesis protein SpsF
MKEKDITVMDTIIAITARLGSTRLKRKHFLKVRGKHLIQWLIDRIDKEFREEIELSELSIVISTGGETENREFDKVKRCKVFYGSVDNIPLRHLQTAQYFNAENIISVDGDDILCSVEAMREVYRALLDGKLYVKTDGLPLGMNAMGYKRSFLDDMLKDNVNRRLETGWTRIFDEKKLHTIEMRGIKNYPYLRFTLDYRCDYDFFNNIISNLYDKIYSVSDAQFVDFVVKNRVFELNKSVAEEYWQNFNDNLRSEDQ